MPTDSFDEDDVLAHAVHHYFRENGGEAMQPANSSSATYCSETGGWLVELAHVRGTLARYRAHVNGEGTLHFEEEI